MIDDVIVVRQRRDGIPQGSFSDKSRNPMEIRNQDPWRSGFEVLMSDLGYRTVTSRITLTKLKMFGLKICGSVRSRLSNYI